MTTDQELLEAARRGDSEAYGQLVGAHRTELHAHCYRMLGSTSDAEDALQEALLGAWRGLPRFEGRSSLRSWLYAIATNVCLKAIERRPKRVLPTDFGPPSEAHASLDAPLADTVWIDPVADEQLAMADGLASPEARYEQRESIELAFVAALQHLPPLQRAVLIIRDVLGFSAAETAGALATTPAAVNSALQRARKLVDERLPEQSQQATLRGLGNAGLRRIVDGYIDAWERADVEGVVALLAEGATIAMPPIPTWFAGREAVGAFLAERPFAGGPRWRVLALSVNRQPGFAHYIQREPGGAFAAHSITVLSLAVDGIAGITAFLDAGLPCRFGLPAELR